MNATKYQLKKIPNRRKYDFGVVLDWKTRQVFRREGKKDMELKEIPLEEPKKEWIKIVAICRDNVRIHLVELNQPKKMPKVPPATDFMVKVEKPREIPKTIIGTRLSLKATDKFKSHLKDGNLKLNAWYKTLHVNQEDRSTGMPFAFYKNEDGIINVMFGMVDKNTIDESLRRVLPELESQLAKKIIRFSEIENEHAQG